MCGIIGVYGFTGSEEALRKRLLKASKLIRHRGPDWSGIYIQIFPAAPGKLNGFAHERLSIVDPLGGAQPIVDTEKKGVLCVNGEIFNHKELQQEFKEASHHKYKTQSDCEVVLDGFKIFGPGIVEKLRGQFAFVVSDERTNQFLVARDPIGVAPLYHGHDKEGGQWFASEMKAIDALCTSYEVFLPGHYMLLTPTDNSTPKLVPYYKPVWKDLTYIPPAQPADLVKLRESFEKAVVRRLMCDVPFGVLISGGLDSSLVASIVCRHAKEITAFPVVHSFSCGLEDSPDLAAAREVAAFLGTKHHEIVFTLQEGLDALEDVIYHLETYDVTSIRASTPMYLMCRKIKSMGVKMVLSGEGADEVFGGYLYFHMAPNKEEFQQELVRKLDLLHLYDCNRANKAPMSWGMETRVPFLDIDFLDVAMNIDPAEKMIHKPEKMEKYILRKAFDTPENPYLPSSVLWRQKEQFSDGVGYGWIDCIKEYAEEKVTDVAFKNSKLRFPHNTPVTKEGYLFRQIFESKFQSPCAALTVPGGPSIACSTPTAIKWAAEWSKDGAADPSGRAIMQVHVASKDPSLNLKRKAEGEAAGQAAAKKVAVEAN